MQKSCFDGRELSYEEEEATEGVMLDCRVEGMGVPLWISFRVTGEYLVESYARRHFLSFGFSRFPRSIGSLLSYSFWFLDWRLLRFFGCPCRYLGLFDGDLSLDFGILRSDFCFSGVVVF
jgi:hypothetical protein